MTKLKQNYEVPEAQALVVRFEGCLCTSPNRVNSDTWTEYISGGSSDPEEL